jgi:hypothetical protein
MGSPAASLLVALPSFGIDISQPVCTAMGATCGSLLRDQQVDEGSQLCYRLMASFSDCGLGNAFVGERAWSA